jgi:hypothetical protein
MEGDGGGSSLAHNGNTVNEHDSQGNCVGRAVKDEGKLSHVNIDPGSFIHFLCGKDLGR